MVRLDAHRAPLASRRLGKQRSAQVSEVHKHGKKMPRKTQSANPARTYPKESFTAPTVRQGRSPPQRGPPTARPVRQAQPLYRRVAVLLRVQPALRASTLVLGRASACPASPEPTRNRLDNQTAEGAMPGGSRPLLGSRRRALLPARLGPSPSLGPPSVHFAPLAPTLNCQRLTRATNVWRGNHLQPRERWILMPVWFAVLVSLRHLLVHRRA